MAGLCLYEIVKFFFPPLFFRSPALFSARCVGVVARHYSHRGEGKSSYRNAGYFGGDHSFSHTTDMIRAKLEILDRELTEFLPSVATRCGL